MFRPQQGPWFTGPWLLLWVDLQRSNGAKGLNCHPRLAPRRGGALSVSIARRAMQLWRLTAARRRDLVLQHQLILFEISERNPECISTWNLHCSQITTALRRRFLDSLFILNHSPTLVIFSDSFSYTIPTVSPSMSINVSSANILNLHSLNAHFKAFI